MLAACAALTACGDDDSGDDSDGTGARGDAGKPDAAVATDAANSNIDAATALDATVVDSAAHDAASQPTNTLQDAGNGAKLSIVTVSATGHDRCANQLLRATTESEGPGMMPGYACIDCHVTGNASDQGDAPIFNFAGTVYSSGHEPDGCLSPRAEGAQVVVTDATGATYVADVTDSGNLEMEDAPLVPPFHAKVTFQGRERKMLTAQVSLQQLPHHGRRQRRARAHRAAVSSFRDGRAHMGAARRIRAPFAHRSASHRGVEAVGRCAELAVDARPERVPGGDRHRDDQHQQHHVLHRGQTTLVARERRGLVSNRTQHPSPPEPPLDLLPSVRAA